MTPRALLLHYLDKHRTDPDPEKWHAAVVALFDEREALGVHPLPVLPAVPILQNRCTKCGLDWSGAMGYVCAQIDCPTRPIVTCSAARAAGETT